MSKLGDRGRRLAAVSAAVALAAAASASAFADGVVVASSSSSHDVGDRVRAGARLQIEAGAEVTVLDRSGAQQRFMAPGGRYAEPAAPAGERQPNLFERLALTFTSLGRRSSVGSVRELDECDPTTDTPAPGCGLEPWSFSVRSGIDGFMSCDYAPADGVWRRLPLGLHGAPAPVGAGRSYEFASGIGAGWPDPEADVAVRCQAVDDATWFALAPSWSADLDADQARTLMESFAEVSGGSFAEAGVEE